MVTPPTVFAAKWLSTHVLIWLLVDEAPLPPGAPPVAMK
jgi:hypothetical protein